MVSIKNLVFLSASAAALVVPRDVSTIESDLSTINADTQKLTSAINAYTGGGLVDALPIASAENTLDNAIKSGTTDANNLSGTVSDADAETIISYINNTLEPNVEAAIDAIIAKKAALTAGGISGIVSSDLKTLASDTTTFGNALIAHAPADQVSAANAALSAVEAQLQRGASAFSS